MAKTFSGEKNVAKEGGSDTLQGKNFSESGVVRSSPVSVRKKKGLASACKKSSVGGAGSETAGHVQEMEPVAPNRGFLIWKDEEVSICTRTI